MLIDKLFEAQFKNDIAISSEPLAEATEFSSNSHPIDFKVAVL